MAVFNNIYPPTLPTYGRTFLLDSGDALLDICRLYFSISSYNSYSDISHTQVTVVHQDSNQSVLSPTKYPCDIMLKPLKVDNTIMSDEKYYIDILKTDLEDGKFEINTYYKVQIRFGDNETPSPTGASWSSYFSSSAASNQAIDSWLVNNQGRFSEWSTVCLVRGISTPTLSIAGLDPYAEYTVWQAANVDIVGQLSFKDDTETDTLRNYRIRLYSETEQLLIDSGDIYTNNYQGINEINYTLKRLFNDGELYSLKIDYTTRTLYSDTTEFEFMIIDSGSDKLDAELTGIEDVDNGRLGLKIKGPDTDRFTGNITIRRTSSESGFTIWEDIKTISLEDEILNFTFWDYTVKSGIFYKYGAQRRNSLGNRGVIKILDQELMVEFEDMFLTSSGTQINIRFNPQISSFQRTVSEGKVDTIGSKYPYIKRNGYTDYKQFPISGTITQFMDKDGIFLTREQLYDADVLELYNERNEEENITPMYDRIYERDFREKIMDFLYKNDVKLFRSTTEGNIMVKLMNITFTPNITLGRKIYDFQCTAYEVADCSIENYDFYGIQELGKINEYLEYINTYVGAIDEVIPAGTDVIQYINDKYQKYGKDGYKTVVEYLDFLRLEFEDDPYLILESAAGPVPASSNQVSSAQATSAVLGHIAEINGNKIIINTEGQYKNSDRGVIRPSGVYELKGENVKVTSLSFPKDTKIRLDYNLQLSQTEDQGQLTKTANYSKKVGQLWGAWKPDDSIFQRIWNHHYQSYSKWYQTITSVNRLPHWGWPRYSSIY